MKIALAQTRPVRGDFGANLSRHMNVIAAVAAQGAKLLIFPELSLTGYEPKRARALAMSPQDSQLDELQTIADAEDITLGVGLPTPSSAGVCISTVVFRRGQPRKAYSKRYLHEDETPFFVPGSDEVGLLGGALKAALAICYELSVPAHARKAQEDGALTYLVSAAKTATGVESAAKTLAETAARTSMTVVMANAVGPCGDGLCAGGSAIWNSEGRVLGRLDGQSEGFLILDFESGQVGDHQWP